MLQPLPLVPVALAVTAVVSGVTALFLWQNLVGSASTSSLERANYAQVLVLALMALIALGQLVLVTVDTAALELFGIYLTSAGMVWTGTAWFVFAFLYTGRNARLTRPFLGGLTVLSLALTVALVTDGIHGRTLVVPAGSASLETVEPGAVTWAAAVYTWVVSGVAIHALFEKFLTSRNVYRKISFMHVVGGTVFNVTGFLSVAGFSPLPHLSLAPTAFSVIIVLSAPTVVTYRYLHMLPLDRLLSVLGGRFRSLTPMARDTILEEMESGVLVVDHENKLVDINPLGRKMITAEDRRIIGKPLTEVVPPSVFETDDTGFLDPDAVEETYRGVWTSAAADARRCFDVQITALGSPDDPAGRVALISDVTDRERRKDQLEQQTRELERQNEQLERFAGVVSHDLRNPLTVAKGYVDGAKDVEDDEAMLDEAEHSLDRMEAIIDDVLTLAREGQSIGETDEVSLGEMARAAWANVDTADAELVVADDASFDADRDRLLNLFENLFRNSVEHGGDDVTVTVDWNGDGFVVADDGPGIPKGEHGHVMESGYTTADDGTGFGLAIVEQIADAHGWRASVGTSSDGGARFSVHDVDQSTIPVRGDRGTRTT